MTEQTTNAAQPQGYETARTPTVVMVSDYDLNGMATAFSIFCAKTVRFLLWFGTLFSFGAAFYYFADGLEPMVNQTRNSPGTFNGFKPGYLYLATIWACLTVNALVLSILVQAVIVFFEHAKNQFVTASAMQLIKMERENAGAAQ